MREWEVTFYNPIETMEGDRQATTKLERGASVGLIPGSASAA